LQSGLLSGVLSLTKVELETTEKESPKDYFFYTCCGSRKTNKDNVMKNVQHILKNESTESNRSSSYKVLAIELQQQLSLVKACKKHALEGWWMEMLVSIYCDNFPQQKLFKNEIIFDAKYCALKINEYDKYLFYIAYAELNYIKNPEYRIDEVLSELIFNPKYKNRIEAYLRFWQLLVKGKYMDFKKAFSLSEVYIYSNHNFNGSFY